MATGGALLPIESRSELAALTPISPRALRQADTTPGGTLRPIESRVRSRAGSP